MKKQRFSLQRHLIFLLVILSLILPALSFSQTSGIAGIWAIDDCEKITQIDLTHSFISSANNAVWNGSAISLFGAQNEVIAFQLIINATGSGASNVTVRLDSLIGSSYVITNTGGIGDPMNFIGKRIELFVESYINVTTKSTQFIQPAAASPAYYSGQIPDALVPFEVGQSKGGAPFNIAPNLNQGVWADIYIPKDAPPDIYSGKAVVYENGVVRYNIPVSLKVYGFALSDSTHFRNMFVVDPSDIRTKHGVTYGSSQYTAVLDNYYKVAHRHRMDLNVHYTPSNLSQQAAGYFTGSSYTLANGYEGPGANIGHGTYGIGVYDQPNNGGTSGFDPATEAGWRAASDTWVTWFKANAPSTVIFKYMTDEPDSTQYDVIKQRASWLHNNPGVGKELKTFCTVKIDPRLYGYIDFWALAGQAGYDAGDHITYGYVSSKVAGRKAAGNKISIYGDARPSYGLWEVIDVEAADSRVNPWISWKYKVDMFFLWVLNEPSWNGRTINAWVDNYLTFEGGSTYIWGMGNFLYTGQNKVFTAYDKGIPGPIASIRMKNWRRGQQDYEYLWLASQLGLQSQVDSIVNSIVPVAFDGYSKQNSAPSWPLRGYAYELARKKIAELVGQKLVGQTERILYTTPSSLSFGSVTINTNSSVQIYTLQGTNLSPASGNITITAPTGYQVSIGSGMSSSLNVPYTGGTLSSTIIYVRFSPTGVQSYTGNITSAGGGATTKNVAVTGTGVSAPTPTLTVSSTSLLFGNAVVNTNSIDSTYTLAGSNLSPAADSLTITVPAGFTISTVSGSGFTSTKKIAYTSGALSAKTIYVRFSPTAVQSYTGNVTNTGGGATIKNIAVTGTGISNASPVITINPVSLEFSNVIMNTNSSEKIYTVQGSNLSPASGSLTITAPAGFTISTNSGSDFTSSKTIAYSGGTLPAKTTYVRFTPTAVQSYTGNITNTSGSVTKNVSVTGTGLSAPTPILTVNPATSSFGETVVNTISGERAYTLAGSNLSPSTDSLTITAPAGFTISTVSGSGFTSSKRIAYTGGTFSAKTIYVRFNPTAIQNYTGNITNTGGGVTAKNVSVIGTGVSTPTPTLTVNPASLSFGDIIVNTISSEQAYILSGSNLTPAIDSLTITAPAGFTISTVSGSGFASSKRIAYTDGTLSAKTIFVKFSPVLIQTYPGNITNEGGGAAIKNVAVTGSGINAPSPVITINPEVLTFSTVRINTISSEIAYSLKGSYLSPAAGSITITAPTGYQVSVTSGSGFSSSISITYYNGTLAETDIYVIFSPTIVQSYNGNITNAGGGAVTQNVAVTGTGIPITSAAMTVNPTSLSFGDVTINTNSKELSYALTGLNLFPASDSLTITAPPGFTISTASGSGFASMKRIAYVSGRLQPIPKMIYVRFSPTAEQSYSDSIINSGGSAATMSLHVSGNGISDLPAPTGTFIASSDTVESRGGFVTLTWTTTNASSVSLNNGIGVVALNGTITRTIRSTTRFILTLSNITGTISYVKTVYVKPRKLSHNKALNKPSTASSIELTGSEANKANDGNVSTSWSSAYVDNQWWQVDLQNITTIENVSLIWNESYASLFTISTSLDGMFFNEVATGYASGSDTVELNFDPINTRYLRLTGIERGTEFGISLSELGIFESESVTTSVDQTLAVPCSFALEQNFPNPFNPSTQIGYQLSKTADVQLVVYDILGKEIATLVNQLQYAGHHTVTFNAKNLASGIYYARLNTEGKVQIRKMMLIK